MRFGIEEHSLILWKDIDEQIFCISHFWNNVLERVSADLENELGNNIHVNESTIRATCYNIWNLNDNWEKRADMIVDNIINVNNYNRF